MTSRDLVMRKLLPPFSMISSFTTRKGILDLTNLPPPYDQELGLLTTVIFEEKFRTKKEQF